MIVNEGGWTNGEARMKGVKHECERSDMVENVEMEEWQEERKRR